MKLTKKIKVSAGIRTTGYVLSLGVCLQSSVQAAKQILVIGDSLSKEYQVEFAHLEARNWIEILDKERHQEFDVGSFAVFADWRATGHEFNWAIPGGTADDLLDKLDSGNFFDERAQDRIKEHLRNSMERAVVFLGGNDIEDRYRRIYDGEDPEPYVNNISRNIIDVLDWVIEKKRAADLEIVLVSVPHVGATPRIKNDYPTDPEKTGRVSAAIVEINNRLRQAAVERGVAYADIYGLTADLLDTDTLCIAGREFINDASEDDRRQYLWLGGKLADQFHPNTAANALVANTIIDAFNQFYDAGIRPLGGTEILRLVSYAADMPYSEWIDCFALTAREPGDDPDGDSLTNLEEYGFDLHPGKQDSRLLPVELESNAIRYRPRLKSSDFFTFTPETSSDLKSWTAIKPGQLQPAGDGWLALPSADDASRYVRWRMALPD